MENHCNILRKSFVSEGVALFLAVLFEVYLKEFASKFCEDLSSSLPFSPQRCAVGLCSICSLQCTQRQRVRRAHFFLKTPCEDTTKTTTMRGMRTAAPPPQRRMSLVSDFNAVVLPKHHKISLTTRIHFCATFLAPPPVLCTAHSANNHLNGKCKAAASLKAHLGDCRLRTIPGASTDKRKTGPSAC